MAEDRSEYNHDRNWENIEFVSDSSEAIVDYEINIAGIGTETARVKYLNKGSLGTGFVLRPSTTVTIVQIGNIIFRNPITVTAVGFSVSKHLGDFNKIVIRTSATSTIIRLLIT